LRKRVKWTKHFISNFLAVILFFTASLLTSPNVAIAETPDTNVENKSACSLNLSDKDIYALGAIVGGSGSTISLGSITLWTTTATSTALWGLIPLTTTVTAVAAPVAGIVAAGGLAVYGGYKVIQYMNCENNTNTKPAPSQS
jgi:ABC-type phosphate/phosphonate transport system permease subunit